VAQLRKSKGQGENSEENGQRKTSMHLMALED
jgi:hypothetical protein